MAAFCARVAEWKIPPARLSNYFSSCLRGLSMIRILARLFRVVFALIIAQLLWTGVAHAKLVNRDWNTGNGFWNVPGNWLRRPRPQITARRSESRTMCRLATSP